jgi:hypothetical protein
MRKVVRLAGFLSTVAVLLLGSGARAGWTGNVYVTAVATDAYPRDGVAFKVSSGPSGCVGANFVFYRFREAVDDNMKAAYATVLAAWLSGKPLLVDINTTTCAVTVLRPGS